MSPHSTTSQTSEGSSQLLWEDDDRIVCRVWRTDGAGIRRAVLVASPPSNTAHHSSSHRFAHECELRHLLDSSWAVRPLELVRDAGRTVLVLEDTDGEPLEHLLSEPLAVDRFLRLAVAAASALGGLHRHGLVHKDIKPTNIIVNESTGKVQLTGFGITSRPARERRLQRPPVTISGTLAYMAPEQTGRMNRSVDFRSDLYSLGITFYQMLTGVLPFVAADPVEWVHCHLAKRPLPPNERQPGTPNAISMIVMKLLEKTAEDRYQSAVGLVKDLQACQSAWALHRRVDDFTLGEHDAPGHFLVPEKLYGRQKEVNALLAAFERVVRGSGPELVLISGPSGIGKSAVVNELNNALPREGLLASGKFDRNNRETPYASFAQAFQRLVGNILAGPQEMHPRYREEILAAVESYGQFITNLAPELERLIGKQPPIDGLDAADTRRVFHQVLRRFIGVFARPERPLILFLDDLQWLDAATLDFLQHLLRQGDIRFLLLVGAYRDTEVHADHPLLLCLNSIRQADVPVMDIHLPPLSLKEVRDLIADTLHDGDVLPLAKLVREKTGGNPLFTIQFLLALAEDRLLAFDIRNRRWVWDESHIAARGFSDNVVDLMIAKISRLPAPCRDTMKVFACIGNSVRADMLSAAINRCTSDVHATLRHAINAGLISLKQEHYSFLHDRVQEASYELVPAADRPLLHLEVGRRLVGQAPATIEDHLFDIVNQFGHGIDLAKESGELERIAELHLKAAQRAKSAAAYVTALGFLRTGIAAVRKTDPDQKRSLAFALALEQAECQFLVGELEQAEQGLSALVDRARGARERAAVACLRMTLNLTKGQPEAAVQVCLEYLRQEGTHFTPHPTRQEVEGEIARMWRALGDRPIEGLANLPAANDDATLATLEVLAAVSSPAWFSDPLLPALIGARIANISIERGNGPTSSIGYARLGMKLGPFSGDYRTGYRFGKLALELAERGTNSRTLARVLNAYTMYVRPWADDLEGSHELLRRGIDAAEGAGDATYATYLLGNVAELMLFEGSALKTAEAACRRALDYARRHKFDFVVLAIETQIGLIGMLQGKSTRFGSFESRDFDQNAFERITSEGPGLTLPRCWYLVRRQQALFLSGDPEGSAGAAEEAEPLLWFADCYFQYGEHHFYAALARAALWETVDNAQRPAFFERVKAHTEKLSLFDENSPKTWGSRAALAAAELARIDGRDQDAMALYEKAIRSARAAGFVQIEALAFEVAARFYALSNLETIALSYRREARIAYLRWGALGKVQQLEERFPELHDRSLTRENPTIDTPVEQLDLSTIVEVSQAISGDMALEGLVHRIMQSAIQYAGAERGLLIRKKGDSLHLDAEAKTGAGNVTVELLGTSEPSTSFPHSIVHYVFRALESVILEDASRQGPFTQDPYVVLHRAHSILCVPLINQRELVGALYLENNLAPHVFTPERTAVLKLVASQAAISLENARLYKDARQMEAYLKAAQALSRTGSFSWRPAAEELVWSDEAFQIFGYAKGMRPTLDLLLQRVHPEDEWRVKAALDRRALDSNGLDIELRLLLPNGSIKQVHVVADATRDESGNHEYVGAVMDITARKDAEEALRKAQAELAHLSRVMTMGELVASIAHEVNQPLTTVVSSTEACLRWLDMQQLDRARRAVSRARTEGHRASEIIRRVRALAKKSAPQMDWIDVNDTILEVVALARSEAQRHSLTVECRLLEHAPPVLADRIQIQQVILNLIMNAIEAMHGEENGPRELLIRSATDEMRHIVVSVLDTGPGFDPTNLERLFDAFYTTKSHGLGMGLSIARSIVDSHGGKLWASKNQPRGAAFHFALPMNVNGNS